MPRGENTGQLHHHCPHARKWVCGGVVFPKRTPQHAAGDIPLATDNLLENTDGVLRLPRGEGRPHQCSLGAAPLLPSIHADARSVDDVIAFLRPHPDQAGWFTCASSRTGAVLCKRSWLMEEEGAAGSCYFVVAPGDRVHCQGIRLNIDVKRCNLFC